MLLDRDLVENCYRRILGREPESEEMIERYVASGMDAWDLIHQFARSEEFRTKNGFSTTHSIMKPRSPYYLATGLNERVRFSCLLHNYRELQATLSNRDFFALLDRGLPILADVPEWPGLLVSAQPFRHSPNEGEITLVLTLRGEALAALGFTIVPASAFGLDGASAILVSHIQGHPGSASETREATKMMDGITPHYALVHLVEGIAKAGSIEWIIGVNGESQPSFEEKYADSFARSYDRLFESLGAEAMPSGLYALQIPRKVRPLDQVPISHRKRTRMRRERKAKLVDAAFSIWTTYLCKTDDDGHKSATGRLRRYVRRVKPVVRRTLDQVARLTSGRKTGPLKGGGFAL